MKRQTYRGQESTIGTLSSAIQEQQNIEGRTLSYYLNHLPYPEGATIVDAGRRFHRFFLEQQDEQMQVLSDHFGNGSVCEFTRLIPQGKDYFTLRLTGNYCANHTKGGGWLFHNEDNEKPHLWLPCEPVARSYDKLGRIVSEEFLPAAEFAVLNNEMSAIFRIPEDNVFIEFVVWTLPFHSNLFEELNSLSAQELQRIFLWGSHTIYSGPEDLYKNLIHGAIYKTGLPWTYPPERRPYCEVIAQALYVTFHSLWKATGKQIYQQMKTQLVFSVIARQQDNGAWCHGTWTEDFEVHYRHHCSGIHLLAADYDETKDVAVGSSLKRAVDYMKNQCDELSVGKWYLHDSLELNVESMRNAPVSYQYSRVLGKSPSNMLVLNTHLDALVAFNRYGKVSGQRYLEEEISSGVNAVVAVLGLKPAEALYRILFKAIELAFLPDAEAKTKSLPVRAMRRLGREKIIPILPRIKRIFPRLVMPNGYIDRSLTLNEFWYPYFLINVMDLLRFQMCFSLQMVDSIIDNAVKFVQRVGLEKWLNNERTAYAVGFWAEAMYLYCLHTPNRSRAALAEAVISLYDSKQGIPPSLLGCNSEYICLADQVPCLQTDNDRIHVINLSTDPHHLEFILVNNTDAKQDTSIARVYDKLMVFDHEGSSISYEKSVTLPPRGWMRLLSHNV
ncbi:MAG: hypothetical protein IT393_05730 [Nitrospirae bacterium]|nr:hypothetical protein [Nitrospirota bacterium]